MVDVEGAQGKQFKKAIDSVIDYFTETPEEEKKPKAKKKKAVKKK